jgi:uncharacterized protein HemX
MRAQRLTPQNLVQFPAQGVAPPSAEEQALLADLGIGRYVGQQTGYVHLPTPPQAPSIPAIDSVAVMCAVCGLAGACIAWMLSSNTQGAEQYREMQRQLQAAQSQVQQQQALNTDNAQQLQQIRGLICR